MKKRILTSINDIAQLSDDELQPCLSALRVAIIEARNQHSVAIREKIDGHESSFSFPAFTWRPSAPSSSIEPTSYGPGTPITELSLKPRVVHFLRSRSVFCLEDLARLSEQELLRAQSVGAKTASRLRDMLEAIGLDFKPNLDSRYYKFDQARAVRALEPEALAQTLKELSDDAPVSMLGLRGTTLGRALQRGFVTVGALRAIHPSMLFLHFGKMESREIHRRIAQTGRIAHLMTDIELWRAGLVDAKDLHRPTAPETPIEDLRPWLVTSIDALTRYGLAKLADLRAVAIANDLARIRGIGGAKARAIEAFLDLGNTKD